LGCFASHLKQSFLNFTIFVLFPEIETKAVSQSSSYLVFARKYRPQNFQELIGQSHLVDILTNAFDKDRIAHAYILTGIRGVGKTTTARIIAKGLNCQSTDRPTINPCGVCSNCISITAGKNIDVFEMDAASRTGIDDIREVIDSIPYKPLNCRYKVYIIDEIHMLSKQAFNGLLKTLEEPPAHVKFIFATTEIHKILPTVLSRCQRLDLKRVDIKTLTAFFAKILTAEAISYDEGAIAKIARSSDGSVRDGLSLLDQAVAASPNHISSAIISDMLGVAQGDEILSIIALCLTYKPAEALVLFNTLYETGFDCYLFVKELLRTTEWLVRLKFTPEIANDASLNETFILKSTQIANDVDVHLLSRMWDIALKATQDIKIAPDSKAVCDMALVRISYGLSLPDPAMMYQKIMASQSVSNITPLPSVSNTTPLQSVSNMTPAEVLDTEKKNFNPSVAQTVKPETSRKITTLADVSKLLIDNRLLDLIRLLEVKAIIHDFKYGYIHLSEATSYQITPKDIQLLKSNLDALTYDNWTIDLKPNTHLKPNAEINKSIYETKKEYKNTLIEEAGNDTLIKAIFTHFPDAKIVQVNEAIALPTEQDLLDTSNHTTETTETEET
jgi:DNA polymerase III subunit gamma/tau